MRRRRALKRRQFHRSTIAAGCPVCSFAHFFVLLDNAAIAHLRSLLLESYSEIADVGVVNDAHVNCLLRKTGKLVRRKPLKCPQDRRRGELRYLAGEVSSEGAAGYWK